MKSFSHGGLSPRIAGALLIVVSVGGGIGAGWLIARAPWSILAVGLLTLATIGMAVGVLWTLRPSWADNTWPPAGRDLPADVRLRRGLRVLGIVLLAPIPVIVALLVWVVVEGTTPGKEMLLIALPAAVYGGVGVWVLRRSRVGSDGAMRSAASDQRPPERASGRDGDGWRVLGGPLKGTFLTSAMVPLVVLGMFTTLQLLMLLDEIAWGGLIWGGVVAVGLVGWLLFVRRHQAPVEANEREQLIRFRGRNLRWSAITRAELSADPPSRGALRTLILSVGDDSTHRGRVVLRRKGTLELSDAETELLAQIIDASAIELPRDKDDPRGRFSRQLHPHSLTKDDASGLVAHPPGADDDLPITTPV